MADSRSQSFFILGLGGPESFGVTRTMESARKTCKHPRRDFGENSLIFSSRLIPHLSPLGKVRVSHRKHSKLATNPTLPSPWSRESRRTAHRHSARSRREYAFLVFPRPVDNVPCEQDGDRGAGPGGFADQRGV